MYCPTKEINEMLKLYSQEVEEEEQEEDEVEEGIQTIMFD